MIIKGNSMQSEYPSPDSPQPIINFVTKLPQFEPLVPQQVIDDMISKMTEDLILGTPKTFLKIGDDKMLVDKLPDKYIINENATILFWKDESKTIVKKSANEEFNARLAFLTAYFQKHCGLTKTQANKYLDNLVVTAKQTKMKQKEVETKIETKPVKKLVKKAIRKEI